MAGKRYWVVAGASWAAALAIFTAVESGLELLPAMWLTAALVVVLQRSVLRAFRAPWVWGLALMAAHCLFFFVLGTFVWFSTPNFSESGLSTGLGFITFGATQGAWLLLLVAVPQLVLANTMFGPAQLPAARGPWRFLVVHLALTTGFVVLNGGHQVLPVMAFPAAALALVLFPVLARFRSRWAWLLILQVAMLVTGLTLVLLSPSRVFDETFDDLARFISRGRHVVEAIVIGLSFELPILLHLLLGRWTVGPRPKPPPKPG